MSDRFKNKYRISSIRLQNWDYGSNGSYFITICTQNREHYFGKITNGGMQCNEIGDIAEKIWLEIPNRHTFIELGNFVVMPNHFHGILIINKTKKDNAYIDVDTINGGFAGINNPMFHENISRIIRWYKGRCSFEIRKIHADFEWQSRFYDHIIRDAQSFERIQTYIENNPKNWKEDKFHGKTE